MSGEKPNIFLYLYLEYSDIFYTEHLPWPSSIKWNTKLEQLTKTLLI